MSLYVYAQFSVGSANIPKACMNSLKELFIGWDFDPVVKPVKVEGKSKFFDKDSFINAIDYYEKEAKGDLNELSRLKGIRQSKEYYTLPDDGMAALADDIAFMKDSFEEHARKVYVCQHMVDTMNMLEDMYGNGKESCIVEVSTE